MKPGPGFPSWIGWASLIPWALATLTAGAAAPPRPDPQWIWHPATNAPAREGSVVYFRKTFRTPPLIWNSRLTLAADDEAEVFLNGVSIATCHRGSEPVRTEVTVRLNQGENAIAVRARNQEGAAGLLVDLNLGGEKFIVSDGSWLSSTREEKNWSNLTFNAAHWLPARSLGTHGIAPWGNVLGSAAATAPQSITVAPGYSVERLRSAGPEEGSWVSLAFDPAGRLIISPEGDKYPLLQVHFAGEKIQRVEPVAAPIRFAMGLLFAFESLYANARGPDGAGLYRLTDANRNNQFDADEWRLLQKFAGGGEHGYHGLALGPDQKIYVLNGNGTKLPPGLSPQSPHRNYATDALERNPEENGGAPAGYILRTDRDGKSWDLWLGGLRNSYGLDFNPAGELFTFDSDMEWDWGAPWYRPTRILHCVSGGEYGWREGTAMWPEYYEDNLPAVVNIGIGSPTGVKFGTGSRFAPRHQQALFVMDWSYGRILAVHLKPRGASYTGTFETFVQGRPLNVTSLDFGPDGNMYFITGGRGTQSGLYRVRYSGGALDADSSRRVPGESDKTRHARTIRHQLEGFHGRADASALSFIQPHLADSDRFIRYAARIALESQNPSSWAPRMAENERARLVTWLARARLAQTSEALEVWHGLAAMPLPKLGRENQLLKLRVIEIGLLRLGTPPPEIASNLVRELDRAFPARDATLNRELSRILAYLGAPSVIKKSLALVDETRTFPDQFHYIAQLRHLREGWSASDRERYFGWWTRARQKPNPPLELARWFADVGRGYVDGAWLDRYLTQYRRDAIKQLDESDRARLASVLEVPVRKAALVPASSRAFVRHWTMRELEPKLARATRNRDVNRGRQAFVDAQCLTCHRFGNDGGSNGPELTAAGSRYDRRSLLESILEPSKVINEQYQSVTVLRKDGDTITGRLVNQTDDHLTVETAEGANPERIERAKIQRMGPSQLSSMPEGLMDTFTEEEILDLLAYLEGGGGRP